MAHTDGDQVRMNVAIDKQAARGLAGAAAVLGLLMAVLGVIVVAWPTATLYVLVVLMAIQFFVFGVIQIVTAFMESVAGAGVRTLVGLGGALSILLGFLVLRQPLQSVMVIGLILGIWWVIRGVFDIMDGVSGHTVSRVWSIVLGIVSVVAGGIVLLQPSLSLHVLVIVAGVWLIVYGVLLALSPLIVRNAVRG